MTARARRVARHLIEVLDWRTFAVAGLTAAVVLVTFLVYSAFSAAHDAIASAHDATNAANKRGAAASRRIDLLNAEIQDLQKQIATGADERGQLAAAVAALSEQIRQLGGSPVVMVTVVPRSEPHPSAQTSPATTPSPRPAATRTPTPSPSPTGPLCRLKITC